MQWPAYAGLKKQNKKNLLVSVPALHIRMDSAENSQQCSCLLPAVIAVLDYSYLNMLAFTKGDSHCLISHTVSQ